MYIQLHLAAVKTVDLICSVSVLMSHSIDFGGERVVGEQVLQMSHNTSQ